MDDEENLLLDQIGFGFNANAINKGMIGNYN